MSSSGAQLEMRDTRAILERTLFRVTHLVTDNDHGHDLTPGEARSLRAIETRLTDVLTALIKLAPR